jgi:hypothetical protein
LATQLQSCHPERNEVKSKDLLSFPSQGFVRESNGDVSELPCFGIPVTREESRSFGSAQDDELRSYELRWFRPDEKVLWQRRL